MKTITAFYKDEVVYIHHLSKFIECAIISYSKDPVKQFKVDINSLSGITEEDLYKLFRDQELEEQTKRKGT
jgi:hypothetical protein